MCVSEKGTRATAGCPKTMVSLFTTDDQCYKKIEHCKREKGETAADDACYVKKWVDNLSAVLTPSRHN
jgi:hypothetical protein